MVKAILIAEEIDPPRWHNIDDLFDLLPAGHGFVAMLRSLGRFTPYAIAYRYPAPDPEVFPDLPAREDILSWLGELEETIKSIAPAIEKGD